MKVIAIGDSGQLSSVQAGGWLGSLTKRLGSHELREVMRQRDPRERQLLSQVRRGAPADYIAEKNGAGGCTSSLATTQSAARASAPRSPRGASARPSARGGRRC